MGVDKQGFSVAARVSDFRPCFYIRIKHKDPESTIDELMDKFKDVSARPSRWTSKESTEPAIYKIQSVKRKRFIGASFDLRELHPDREPPRKTYNLLRVVCSNILSFEHVVKAFKNDDEKWMIHDDFNPINQFLQQTNIQYQSWINVSACQMVCDEKRTYCNLECEVKMDNLSRCETVNMIPRTLKCFLNITALSRDATVDPTKSAFRQDPERMFDRVMVCCITYVWSDNVVPVKECVYSLIGPDACQDEETLFKEVQQSILGYDPDTILYYPDEIDPIAYMSTRAQPLLWERFKSAKMWKTQLNTRTLFDLRAPIRKKASVLVEAYDLHTVSCHKDLRKVPEKPKSFLYRSCDFPNLVRSHKTRHILVSETVRDNGLIVALERDCNLRIEYANISQISNCPLHETVSGGEQIRVLNKLHDYTKDDFFINKEAQAKGPVRFPITERPPTFMDDEEFTDITALREKSFDELNRKRKRMNEKPLAPKKAAYVDPFAGFARAREESDESEEECEDEEEEKEGGNVVKPCPNFYPLPIGVVDFNSLYPNIMRAFNISYENLITNRKYLDIPGVKYIFVPINSNETIGIVDSPGVMGKLLAALINERSKVKKLMAKEKDPFKKTNYDKQQESLKVICNATYGFCGADQGSLLAIKPVMYVVTSLGRYLQKRVSKFICEKYTDPATFQTLGVYGDTDSIFLLILSLLFKDMKPTKEQMPEFVQRIGDHYEMHYGFLKEMGPDFEVFANGFTWDSVIRFYAERWEPEPGKFRLNIRDADEQTMCNAVVFLVFKKLAHESSELLRKEIVLEFENYIDNLWLGWVKKHYFGRKWMPDKPHAPETKLKTVGMQSKRRDWCTSTRAVLCEMQDLLATGQFHLVRDVCTNGMRRLASGQVPIDELKVSCKYKGALQYKNHNSRQMQIVLKTEKRYRCKVPEKSRIFYVIIRGDQPLAMRAETPEYAAEHKLPLDIQYYLEKQFRKPVKELLAYHPEIMDFDKEFGYVLANVKRGTSNMVDIADPFACKKLCVEDLRKRSVPKPQPKRKPSATNPFDSMKKCKVSES